MKKIWILSLVLTLGLLVGCVTTYFNKNKIADVSEHVVYVGCEKKVNPLFFMKTGFGSGVIVDEEYVVTNFHVVDKADIINVISRNGQEYKAKLIKKDSLGDLALLKVVGLNEKPITLGNYKSIHVGDRVFAIGHPFGLTFTTTAGIISYKDRFKAFDNQYYIQTDVTINSGNSGGALVDKNGKLIGITTSYYSPVKHFTGYAFCIPINKVKEFIK